MKRSLLVGVLIFIGILLFIVFPSFFVVIDAGEVGVQKIFGSVDNNELKSGLHFKNPFTTVVKMNIRTDEYTMSVVDEEDAHGGDDSIQARALDGATLWLDLTVFYRLDENKASDVYKNLGLDYAEKIIRPEIRSEIREVVALYPVNEVYSTKRTEIVNTIKENLAVSLGNRGIVVEDVLLRNVTLSSTLANSIEEKLTAQQEAEKFDFILQTEEKEAERKRIEAEGQRDSQQIINESLTDKYLYYLYLTNLAGNENVIYVPTEGGIPLFKGI